MFKSIGADPELFVQKNGVIIPATEVTSHSKDEPFEIKKGCCMHYDNAMLEFSIVPTSSFEDFNRELVETMNFLKSDLPKGVTFREGVSTYLFDKRELTHPDCWEFGCSPDINAWTETLYKAPDAKKTGLRGAGGHVHVGYEDPNTEYSFAIAKALDLYLGVPSILMDPDRIRRKQYGKAAACRLKDYGVEYRVLSNFWIWSVDTRKWVYEGVQRALEFVENNGDIDSNCEPAKEIRKAINEYNVDLAKKICENNNVKYIKTNSEELAFV